MLSRLVNFLTTQFTFNQSVAAIFKMQNSIGFQPHSVVII